MRRRAVVLVANSAAPYSRGLRVARSLAEAGFEVEIAATTGDGQPVEALAEVRWCRPFIELDDLPAGVGLRFIDTPLRAAVLSNELRRARLS